MKRAFTIVEILIVIVVIGILATIVMVSYSSINRQAAIETLKVDLQQAVADLGDDFKKNGVYSLEESSFKRNQDTNFDYQHSSDKFCITATSSRAEGVSYYATESQSLQEGSCDG